MCCALCMPCSRIHSIDMHAGTIFHTILVWQHTWQVDLCGADTSEAIHRTHGTTKSTRVAPLLTLRGHVGSLMTVRWARNHELVLSAADDRTARVWRLPPQWQAMRSEAREVHPLLTLWGHEARVWDVCLMGRCALSCRQ